MRTSGGYRSHGYLNTGQASRNKFIVSTKYCVHRDNKIEDNKKKIQNIIKKVAKLFINLFIISMMFRIFLDKHIYLKEPSVSCRAIPLWETTTTMTTTRNSTWNFERIRTRFLRRSKRPLSPNIISCGPWVTAFQLSTSIDGNHVTHRWLQKKTIIYLAKNVCEKNTCYFCIMLIFVGRIFN